MTKKKEPIEYKVISEEKRVVSVIVRASSRAEAIRLAKMGERTLPQGVYRFGHTAAPHNRSEW